ncbi:Xaa-Pro aminopeptidase [Tindallia magadiensis]|uniref:Xaa-Pro aminopeptidase n=1 Tax=Tindallia magadiensis TaxID=69895 RepID=A0A1I3C001_9FIRM|nr:Xaa-Pro peptidase family protein [Tindallia magadiensis]SFH67800.1 Xaa-Pro aminopeptidase [Tindallia magadiensis]
MSIYQKRIEKLQEKMQGEGIECLFLSPSVNLNYLTGYGAKMDERLVLFVLPTKGEGFFVAPKLYEAFITKTPIRNNVFWGDQEDPFQMLLEEINKRGMGITCVALENSMPAAFILPIQTKMEKTDFCLANDLFESLRKIKSKTEIEKLKNSATLIDNILKKVILEKDWIGRTEKELAATLEQEMKQQGMEGPSFSPIIATGSNSASPHHKTGTDKILKNQPLLMDFGGLVDGFCSDMSRTIFLGDEPDEFFLEIYEIVLEAQKKGIEAVRPKVSAESIDKVVRDYIISKGYGDFFIHRTGHGIGMEVHESPYIVEGNKEILEPGMLFSIEPGIYLPGKFGVRIEDIVLVTDTGCQVLNQFPKKPYFG